jgi:YD repeat-containing protein
MKKQIFLFLFSAISLQLYSQIEVNPIDTSQFRTLETIGMMASASGLSKIIPPSPEVANFMNYVNNPVNVKTGSCNFNVPLYEVSCGDLMLPISLNYYSNGRKTYEMNGPVGLGWQLNTGGMISRTVYGYRDDNVYNYPSPMPDVENLSNQNNWDFLAGISQSINNSNIVYDTQYDIFSYNFGGSSGNFILKDINNVKVPEVIPNRKLKIDIHKVTTPNPMFDYIEITDEAGVFYRFGKSIVSGSSNRENTGNNISAWFISEIISANKRDTIHFKYTTSGSTRYHYSQLITVRDQHSFYGSQNNPAPNINDISTCEITNQLDYSTTRIDQIIYRNGKIKFEKGTNSNLLSKMTIYSNNEIIRIIEFDKSILDSPIGLYTFGVSPDKSNYKLNKIIFKDKNNVSVNQYLFEYFPSPTFNVRHNDWWGYYNGADQNPYYLIPVFTIPYHTPVQPPGTTDIGNTEAQRNANPGINSAYGILNPQFGILKSVTYPTGGKVEFFYEANQYKSSLTGLVSACGGVRISKTVHSENGIPAKTKTFKYGTNENGYGSINYEPGIGLIGYEQPSINIIASQGCKPEGNQTIEHIRVRYYSSDILPQYKEYFDTPVMYPEIAVYEGTPADNQGKTIYKYETLAKSFAHLNPVYDSPYNSEMDYNVVRKHDKQMDLWRNNELTEKIVYDNNNNKVFKERYSYATKYSGEITGIHSERLYSTANIDDECCIASYGRPVYIFDDYKVLSGVKLLSRKTEVTYSGTNDSLVVTNDYTYNQQHLLSSSVKSTSTGTLKTLYFYPSDYGAYFSNLTGSRNILGLPIDIRTYNGTQLISGEQTKYNDFGQPIDYYNFESSATDMAFNATIPFTFTHKQTVTYDASCKKPTMVHHDDDVYIHYIWGYNQQYPIATIVTPLGSPISIDVVDNSLSKSDVLADIQNDVNYLKTILQAYRTNANYQVTIYTYKPLVGLTSQTDPTGTTTYFRYDSFGRLEHVTDDDGNLLQKNVYHYAGM